MYYSVFELQEMSAKIKTWTKDVQFTLFCGTKMMELSRDQELFLSLLATDYDSVQECLVSDSRHLDHYLSYMNYVLEKVLVETDGDDLLEALLILYDLLTHDEGQISAILESEHGSEFSCKLKFVLIERLHNDFEQLKRTKSC